MKIRPELKRKLTASDVNVIETDALEAAIRNIDEHLEYRARCSSRPTYIWTLLDNREIIAGEIKARIEG